MNPIHTLKERLHRLKDDERAVSPVIGFVLMFALIIMVFTLYQTNVVPAANTEVEFDHSQEVEGQMSVLNDQVIQTAMTEERRSATISTGLQYPSRTLAINPGNSVGTLQTVSTPNVTISGIDTESGTTSCEYGELSFLSYQPNYNRLDEETIYSIEYGMLVQDYSSSDATNLQSEGVAFPDTSSEPIQLILMEGDVQASQMTTSVATEYVHKNYTPFESGSSTTISLPTKLSESDWNELLTDKNGITLSNYTDNAGAINTANIGLDAGRTIQIKKVTPGGANNADSGCDRERYIVNETPLSPNVSLSTGELISVSVEDQFGNQITSNVTVNASTTGGGELDTTSRNLNASGQAPFTYNPVEADSGSTVEVDVSLRNGSANGSRTFELDYPELYINNETPLSQNLSAGENATLRVSVSDSAGNSLSGIDIDTSTTGDGTVTPANPNSTKGEPTTLTYHPAEGETGLVEVTASLPNASNGNDSVTFELVYSSEESTGGGSDNSPVGDTVEPSEVTQPPINTSAIARSNTHPSFRIEVSNQSNPIEISGFAIETKNDLSGITETERPNTDKTHNFKVYQTGLSYESDTTLQLDGSVYMFGSEGAVTSSRVQIERFHWRDGIRLRETVDSYAEADVTIWFILTDGTVRPVYFDAAVGPGNG